MSSQNINAILFYLIYFQISVHGRKFKLQIACLLSEQRQHIKSERGKNCYQYIDR